MIDPPVREAPPAVADGVGASFSDWAECLVQYADVPQQAEAEEVWVFRKRDFSEFQRLIGLRLRYKSDGPSKFGAERRKEAEGDTKVTCRERSVDPDLLCAECVRVFTGGAYRDKAISVPAHPAQRKVMGCLALSQGTSASLFDEGSAHPLSETAFCNSVNARFSMVNA